jgi:hypothetical protein
MKPFKVGFVALLSVPLAGACVANGVAEPPTPGSPPTVTGDSDGAASESPSDTSVTPNPNPIGDQVHFVGRFDRRDPKSIGFSWPGSAIWTRFSGSALSVRIRGAAWFDVEIDGVPAGTLQTSDGVNDYGLYGASGGLTPSQHNVKLTRRTEAFLGATYFEGFAHADLIPTLNPQRSIEFIGDEATAGWGVLGSTGTCPFNAATESEPMAWGALAAAELGVAHTTLAYSGHGVMQNYGGSQVQLLPELYERTLPGDADSVWDFSDHQDVVVVQAGTADFYNGDPGPGFVDAYETFLGQIRSHRPDAWIVVASSPVLHGDARDAEIVALKAAVQDMTTAGATGRISFLELPQQINMDGYGCGYQPSQATQQIDADLLVDHLESLQLDF